MDVQQRFLDSIRNDFNEKQSHSTVIGACLNRYSFSGSVLDNYCSGDLLFQQDGPPLLLLLVKVWKLRRFSVYLHSFHILCFLGLCNLAAVTVCVNFENWSAVCYEKYDLNLGDWMQYVRSGFVNDAAKVNVMVGERCLCPYWIDEIR